MWGFPMFHFCNYWEMSNVIDFVSCFEATKVIFLKHFNFACCCRQKFKAIDQEIWSLCKICVYLTRWMTILVNMLPIPQSLCPFENIGISRSTFTIYGNICSCVLYWQETSWQLLQMHLYSVISMSTVAW